MTATVQASEAADRLREVISPGGTVWAISRGFTRSGVEKVSLHVARVSEQYPESSARDVTAAICAATGLPLVPNTDYLGCGQDFGPWLAESLDRLSVALFGELGQIRGEYL